MPTTDTITTDTIKSVCDRLQAMSMLHLRTWYFNKHATAPRVRMDSFTEWKAVHVLQKHQSGKAGCKDYGCYRTDFRLPVLVGGRRIDGAAVWFTLLLVPDTRDEFPDVEVYMNGARMVSVAGSAQRAGRFLVTRKAEPGLAISVIVRIIQRGLPRFSFTGADLVVETFPGPDPATLRETILGADHLRSVIASEEYGRAIDESVRQIDFDLLACDDQAPFLESLRVCHKSVVSAIQRWGASRRVHLLGHAHIDTAWLRPRAETVELLRDDFRAILRLIDEYPGFVYAQGSAQHFEWIEDNYPEMFERIRHRVTEGRWEIVGGMWVEPDLNLPDGESLVRQLLFGKRYFLTKFGVDVQVGWILDSFGYSWQLPQLLSKSGIDSFITQKLDWNDTTPFPYRCFYWESPDGSRVLTYFPKGYANTGSSPEIAAALTAGTQQPGLTDALHILWAGHDGGGGGDSRRALEAFAGVTSNNTLPIADFGSAAQFIETIKASITSGAVTLPTWRDELYLEYHRGSYTTHGEFKHRIRCTEVKIMAAETFAAWAMIVIGRQPFSLNQPRVPDLTPAWKALLVAQFHDLVTGTTIPQNVRTTKHDLEQTAHLIQTIERDSLNTLADYVDTSAFRPTDTLVGIFNPVPFPRDLYVSIEAHLQGTIGNPIEVRDADGTIHPSEVLHECSQSGRVLLRVWMRGLPSSGYKVLALRRTVSSLDPGPRPSPVTHLENEHVFIMLNQDTGGIVSLVDKQTSHDLVRTGSAINLLHAFQDTPSQYDAWNIERAYLRHELPFPPLSGEITVIERTQMRTTLRMTRHFQASTIIQELSLMARERELEVRLLIDWNDEHVLLKAASSLSTDNSTATYAIPFGWITRSTDRITAKGKGQFEVPALRWADLGVDNCGLTVITEAKYGFDAVDNTLSLSLLRSPTWPDPGADKGRHEIRYWLLPRNTTWQETGVMRRACELNSQPAILPLIRHAGTLPPSYSFVTVSPGNIIITAVKKAEDDDSLIVRLLEFHGIAVRAELLFGMQIQSVAEVDLLERARPANTATCRRNLVSVTAGPHSIVTLKLTLHVGAMNDAMQGSRESGMPYSR
jgi:alpha-mannosidase